MSREVPVIAIVTPNTLMSMGLQRLLEGILPYAAFKLYSSVEQIESIPPEDIFHLFVSSQILIENVAYFESRRNKTIALTSGGPNSNALQGFHQINIMQSEQEIIASVRALHGSAHGRRVMVSSTPSSDDVLSCREVEVLKLIVEGLINKEIAQRLNIGVTTVITHRKNIFEKLGIRSVAGLTIYAVMKRYVDI